MFRKEFVEVITKTGLRKIAYNGEEVLFASSNVKNGKVDLVNKMDKHPLIRLN